jgi:hypothetical protein
LTIIVNTKGGGHVIGDPNDHRADSYKQKIDNSHNSSGSISVPVHAGGGSGSPQPLAQPVMTVKQDYILPDNKINEGRILATNPSIVAQDRNGNYIDAQGNAVYAAASYQSPEGVPGVLSYSKSYGKPTQTIVPLPQPTRRVTISGNGVAGEVFKGAKNASDFLNKASNEGYKYADTAPTILKYPAKVVSYAAAAVANPLERYSKRDTSLGKEVVTSYGLGLGAGIAGGEVLGALETRAPAVAKSLVLGGEAFGLGVTGASFFKFGSGKGVQLKTGNEFGQQLPSFAGFGLGIKTGLETSPVSPYLVPSANELVKSKIPLPSFEKINYIETKGGEYGGSSSTALFGVRYGTKAFPLASYDEAGITFGSNKISARLAEKLLSSPSNSGYELGGALSTKAAYGAGIKVGNTGIIGAQRLAEAVPTIKNIYAETGKNRYDITGAGKQTQFLNEKQLSSVYGTAKQREDILFGSLGRSAYGVQKPDFSFPKDFDFNANKLTTPELDFATNQYVGSLRKAGVRALAGETPGTIELKGVKIGEIKGGVQGENEIEPSLYTGGFTKAFPVRRLGKDLPRVTDLPQEIRNLGSNILTLQRTDSGADYLPFPKRAKDISSFFQAAKTGKQSASLSKSLKSFEGLYSKEISGGSFGAAELSSPSSGSRSLYGQFPFFASPSSRTSKSFQGLSVSLSPKQLQKAISSPSASPSKNSLLSPIKSPLRSPSQSLSSPLRSPSRSGSPSKSLSPRSNSPSIPSPSFSPSPSLSPSLSPSSSLSRSLSRSSSSTSLSPPLAPPFFPPPFGGAQKAPKISFGKRSPRKSKYTPSFYASFLKIKSRKRNPKSSGYTGLEIRGITKLAKRIRA